MSSKVVRFAMPAAVRHRPVIGPHLLSAPMRVSPLVLIAAVILRRSSQMGTYVSGLDNGDWFAIGRHIFHDGGTTSASAYAPLVPVVSYLGQLAIDPLLVAKLLSLGSLAAIAAATHFVASHLLRPWFALMVTAAVVLAGNLTETMIYGGCPQNYACAFALLATFFFARFLEGGRRCDLLWGGGSLASVAISHHMYFAVACVLIAAVWAAWITTLPQRAILFQRTRMVAGTAIPAMIGWVSIILAMRQAGYRAPINITHESLSSAFRWATLDAPLLWPPVFIASVLFTVMSARHRSAQWWQVQFALLVVPFGLFLATSEARLLPLAFVGASLAMGRLFEVLGERGRSTIGSAIPHAIIALFPLLLLPQSDARASFTYGYYRVVDPSLLRTATYIEDHRETGLVAVRPNRWQWPIGWWFEGLTHARIATGSSPVYLAFPEQQARARVVDSFFAAPHTSSEITTLARANDVAYLVFKKWEWIGWQQWTEETNPTIDIVFDDGEFMVVKTSRPIAAAVG